MSELGEKVRMSIERLRALEAAKAHYPKANEMIAWIILIPAANVRPVVMGEWLMPNADKTDPCLNALFAGGM